MCPDYVRSITVEYCPSAGAVRQLHRHDGTEHQEKCLRGDLPCRIQFWGRSYVRYYVRSYVRITFTTSVAFGVSMVQWLSFVSNRCHQKVALHVSHPKLYHRIYSTRIIAPTLMVTFLKSRQQHTKTRYIIVGLSLGNSSNLQQTHSTHQSTETTVWSARSHQEQPRP